MNLPQEFLSRMKERLGEEFPAFLQSYQTPPVKAIRVNSLKISREEFQKISPFTLIGNVPWEANGYLIDATKAGSDAYHFAGLYYSQEPSAMFPVSLLEVSEGERVLDLCAAPGGKATQIACALNGKGILIANEHDYTRCRILSENMERLGVRNAAAVNAEPSVLAERFPEYFDKILVDAPCSGEGMFRKDPFAAEQWSPALVRGCAYKQKEILTCAARTLRKGGRLVYSTCTFSAEENEGQIESFIKSHPEFVLLQTRRLYPHEGCGEGQFAALLEKTEGGEGEVKRFPVKRAVQAERAFSDFSEEFLQGDRLEGDITTLSDGRMYLLPADMPVLGVRTLRFGLELGVWDGKTFKPAHALAASIKRSQCNRFLSLSREESEKYLRGETIGTDIPNGWCVVGIERFPLGLGKAVNGIIKNHFPKGLRKR